MPQTAAQTNPEHQESRTREKRGCTPVIGISLLLLLLVGAGAFSAMMVERTILAPYETRIYPNVYVLGENLGGFTVEEASHHLHDVFASHDTGDLILSDGDQSWRIPWSEAGMRLDVHATAEHAFAVGRENGWQTLISMWLGKHAGGIRHDVSPVFSIDAQMTRRALEKIAPDLYEPATDATFKLDGDQLVTTPSRPGRALDVDATTEKIINTVRHLGPDYPFAPTYETVQPRIENVDGARAQAEDLLNREIRVAARGDHEGETFRWNWTLGRETIASWLRVEKTEGNPGFDVHLDPSAVEAAVAELAAEPEAGDWGFPREQVTEEILELFEAGGGEFAVELTPPPRIYVVQSGDRLTTIAAKFGMPPGLIAELNRDIDLNQLYVGQELIIPPQDVLTPYETVPNKRVVISIPEQRLRAYENGQLLYDWPCSTGKKDSPTYTGQFQVLSKDEMAYASQWDLEMPHFIGVYRAGGATINGIHALPFLPNGQRLWAGNLGSRASFGCIILGVEEAETLFNWVELGVPVTIE
jgi:lipoprotein-anchoring transpeptidase ErfK/SrfK